MSTDPFTPTVEVICLNPREITGIDELTHTGLIRKALEKSHRIHALCGFDREPWEFAFMPHEADQFSTPHSEQFKHLVKGALHIVPVAAGSEKVIWAIYFDRNNWRISVYEPSSLTTGYRGYNEIRVFLDITKFSAVTRMRDVFAEKGL